MKRKNNFFIWFLILNYFSLAASAKNNNFANSNFGNSKKVFVKKEFTKNENLEIKINKFLKLIANNIQKSQQEKDEFSNLEILSEKQLSQGDDFIAEGNVLARNNKILLRADKLVYSRKLRELFIEGNIVFQSGDQFLKSTELKYNIKKKEGYILNAFGTINFETLGKFNSNNNLNITDQITNVIFNSSNSLSLDNYNLDRDDESFLKRLIPQELKIDISKKQQWRYKAKKINIVKNIWSSEKLFLTNDPFNKPQLVINNKNFKTTEDNEEILVTSQWSTLILDDFLKIPIGPRRIKIGEENNFRWGIGYDKSAKDGLFITRNFDPIYFSSENTKLNLKKEFYIQRSLQGKTKSYSAEDKSVLSEKVDQDITPLDFFGIELDYLTKVYGFDLSSNITLSTLDLEKFKKALSVKTELTKSLYKKTKSDSDKETKFSIFGNYRDKVWNGSLGESEILSAYGIKLVKQNNWTNNKINKSSTIAFSIGEYQSGERLYPTNLISRKRLNIFLERNHRYPIWRPKIKNNLINKKLIYSPTIINYGMDFNAQAKLDIYRYDDKNYQNLLTFRAGPELTLGNFKSKYFDYTKLSIYPKATISDGNSPFGFDQSVDNHSIELLAKQQLIGPLALELSTEYNLDVNSPKYNKFFNTKYELTWNRRAYNLGIYYNSETETGGIKFNIHSFNFDGIGDNF